MGKMKILGIFAVVVLAAGFCSDAYAGRGCGRGKGRMMNMSNACPYMWSQGDAKVEAAIKSFTEATTELRLTIYEKEMALQAELAKKEPDAKAAMALQKELSGFKAQLDQKWLEHVLEMKKIDPAYGASCAGCMMRGGAGNCGFMGRCGRGLR